MSRATRIVLVLAIDIALLAVASIVARVIGDGHLIWIVCGTLMACAYRDIVR